MIWKVKPTVEVLNSFYPKNHIGDYIGIEFTEIGEDYITGKMPVDNRTRQPMGLLHGGASCVLAETLGSVGASLCIDQTKQVAVGLDINANHLRAAREGYVYGTAKPIHIGRSTQVWEIKIVNESNQLVCISRLTMAVKDL
jgi:1,4-dihydroxy-2-naphthoyl-CoA hydrolase